MTKYDVIVAGAGAMGMSAGYFLAKEGKKVLMIDAFDPPHTSGSHHGDTRIMRHANGEGIQYVPLALRSQEIWNYLQAQTNDPIFMKTGVISFGLPDSKFVDHALEGAQKYNIEHEYFEDGPSFHDRWADLQFEDKIHGVYEPHAGILFPENIIRTFKRLALDEGAELKVHEPVEEITILDQSVLIKTNKKAYTADQVIVAAGAYNNKLFAQMDLNIKLEPSRRTIGWFDADETHYGADVFPGFFGETHHGVYYGFPSVLGTGVKIGKFYDIGNVEPEYMETVFNGYSHDEKDLRDFLNEHMPNATGNLNKGAVCMFTNTSDEDFVIDKHPQHDHIVLAAGFSGHGFKHSAAIGEILAQLAIKGESEIDISAFSAKREALNYLFSEKGPSHF